MDFLDVVTARKSVRDYSEKAVEEDKLTQILEAARLAPSWANKQCCRYVVVTNRKRIEELSSIFIGWIKQAPVIIAACADPKQSGSKNGMDYYLVDVGISMQQLVLAATNFGLGSCWIGGFDESKIKQVLQVPPNIKVIALSPIGYPANTGVKSKLVRSAAGSDKRKPLEEIIHREKW